VSAWPQFESKIESLAPRVTVGAARAADFPSWNLKNIGTPEDESFIFPALLLAFLRL
jgi:hypothetical protein